MILRNENELLSIYQLNLSEIIQMKSNMKQSHRRQSPTLSFTKFVAHLQHTFSSKNLKSSTPIIQQTVFKPKDSSSKIPIFPSMISNTNHLRCRLSQILYDPSQQIDEYHNDIEEKTTTSGFSESSFSIDGHDSCYNSLNENHSDRFNLSQMNVSMNENHSNKPLKLPTSFDTTQFHSTAIHDIGTF